MKIVKALILTAAACGFLFFAGRLVIMLVVSDETKIRWQIQQMTEDFNATKNRAFMSGIAEDYRDQGTSLDYASLRLFLGQLFLSDRDPETKLFRHRAEVPQEENGYSFDVETPGEKITVSFFANFYISPFESAEARWVLGVQTTFEKRDGDWKVVRSKFEPQRGKNPFR